jgi:hypothetical protein
MKINKKNKEVFGKYSSLENEVERFSLKKNRIILYIFFFLIIISQLYYLFKNYSIQSNNPTAIMDRYIDCVNLGECEDITKNSDLVIEEKEEVEVEKAEKILGNSKLGQLVTYKGVYINSKILEAIDSKFNKADAEKLKIIMLAECAKDYKKDGVAIYECKSTGNYYNEWNNTWDCGYLQINQKGRCTEKSFSIDYQIEKAYNKIHSINNEGCGGFKCWSSYKFRNSKEISTNFNKWNSK